MTSPRVDRPVFIVGCGRSGTTLLFQLMRKHPGLAPTTGYPDGEDHVGWNTHGDCKISGLGYADVDLGHTGYHYCLYMDEQDVTEDVIGRMHAYYAGEVLKGTWNKRVLNKCPHLSNKLRYVQALFPDAFFVHIVRDVVPVVASWIKMMDEQPGQVLHLPDTEYPCLWVLPAPTKGRRDHVFRNERTVFPGGGTDVLTDYWRKVNENIPRQLADSPARVLTVRYEDLCEQPAVVLQRIFAHCELPAADIEPVDDYGRQVRLSTKGPRDVLSDAQVEAVLDRASDVRTLYGYA